MTSFDWWRACDSQMAKCHCLPSVKTTSRRPRCESAASVLPHLVTVVSFACAVLTKPVVVAASHQASQSSLPLNSTLRFNQTIVSPGGVFALGFYSGTRSLPVSTLAIWYAHASPAKMVVWFPDRGLALSENAALVLSPRGELQVYDDSSVVGEQRLMWTSNTSHLDVANATILDTGNLVLVNSAQAVVWQSFDSPTSTLLPTQRYRANSSVGLRAWRTPEDWSDSPYSLHWSASRTLTAFWSSNASLPSTSLPYWSAATPASSVVLTEDGEFEFVRGERREDHGVIGRSASGVGVSNGLLRLTLDSDGNLRMYSWGNGSSQWEIEWEALEDVCEVSGYCGPFALCSNYGECTCPLGFRFVSEDQPRLGCARGETESSSSSSSLCGITTMVTLPYTDYVSHQDATLVTDVSVEDCVQSCLADCSCAAASVFLLDYGFAGNCWLRNNTLWNGQYALNATTYLRTVVPPRKPAFGLSDSSILKLVAVTLGASVFVLGLWACVLCGFRVASAPRRARIRRLQKKWAHGSDAAIVRFTFREVELITNHFAAEIGKGGYGTVFKGHIGDHDDRLTPVAVKRLDKLANGEREFVNEVDIIGQIHHFHLVHLLGYCAEAEHRILVYEYVEEGSLDRLLFRGSATKKSPVLEWRLRFQIAVQTARALAYLHDDCDQRIVHCDVKPENILLDAMFRAKVADFGLSRIMSREQTQTITMQVRGTRGYLAPEWTCNEMPITAKTDVFSYGMLLLELISGRRNLRTTPAAATDAADAYFPMWAYPFIETAAFMDVVDPSLTRIANAAEVRRALLVAFWCINDKPQMRPAMVQVVRMLEGHVPVEEPVPRPDFFNNVVMTDDEDGGTTDLFVTSTLEY